MTFQNLFNPYDHDGPRSYEELLARDGRSDQDLFRLRGETDVGPTEVPTSWYLDKEIHDREIERIWKKVWQVACRVEDLPKVGDIWLYEVATISIIIVRVAEDRFKAYYNSCLHRGAALRTCSGRASNLQCPFHGFIWSLEGELKQVPSPEQFPDLDAEKMRLPEVKVDCWGGFVFINMDPDAEPLADFVGTFGDEFARAPLDERVKRVHVRKILGANWKVAQEAFMEGYHVFTTHPQNIPIASSECMQHDVFDNYCRGILGRGVASEYMGHRPSEQDILDVGLGRWLDQPENPPLAEGQTARQRLAEIARERLRSVVPDRADSLSEAELVDTIYFTLFPNFHPMSSLVQPMVYLFRPYGDDHTRSVMDIMFILPKPPGAPDEEPPAVIEIGEDEPFSKAPEIGFLGAFLNQDISNLSKIMTGLRNNQSGKIMLAREHELMIRHFYALYMKAMDF